MVQKNSLLADLYQSFKSFQIIIVVMLSIIIGLLILREELSQTSETTKKEISKETKTPKKNTKYKKETPRGPRKILLPPPPKLLTKNELSEKKTGQIKVKYLKPYANTPAKKIASQLHPLQKNRSIEKSNNKVKITSKEQLTPKIISFNLKNRSLIKKGRLLLRVLEHGKGPNIEIAWPQSVSERTQLYKILVSCHGMKIALMNKEGELFINEGTSGQGWFPNMDIFSGYMRQAIGKPVKAEEDAISIIKKRHNLKQLSSLVRIFPRKIDAYLLAGLQRLAGNTRYSQATRITAAYKFSENSISIDSIKFDGRGINGELIVGDNLRC